MAALLEVAGVSKNFSGLRAVADVSFAVPEGEIFAVIGPNGAGKTTLFNMIAGVFPPNGGTIAFAGERIDGHAARRGVPPRHRPHLPARAAVSGADRRGQRHRRRAAASPSNVAAARAHARDVLRAARSLRQARRSRPSALTLPDRKRLEVARALATDPKLLLLDEVMAGLRPTETDRMVEILTELNRETGLTILLIEHVMRAVMALASRVLVLHHGAAIAEGTPGGGRARSGGGAVLSRRGGGLMLRGRATSTCSTATPRRSTACRSRSPRARSSPSSAPTAPARPR